jgi:hypothetical protein
MTAPKPKVYTIDTAPVDVLRQWYRDLHARHLDGRDDRHLGWWITHNAATVTITTPLGHTITATGELALRAIKDYETALRRADQERAA